MKQLNTFKKATPLLLIAAMTPAMATDVNVPLNFTTLPVITIAEITPMDFGAVLSLTLADTCTMSTSAGTALTPAQEGVDSTNSTIFSSATLAQNSVGELSGSCSGADDGQVGIYEITSFADANITVSVTTGTATDISFEPVGYVTDLDEAGGNFTRETLNTTTDALVNSSTSLTAYAQAGTNRAIVGGTITNFAALNAGDAYATDFNLNVVYQ
ncbi:hypothetical protein [uncultured Paraglaciecola sp.]|uniref:hypothetical protein n=1 Tax=uncultured Paraglaciecola sp. TaxID=1765024 RepID=UPI0030DBE241|tara:strand:+ start:20525 stop:21166 length:642 start_codon:yes stop_codon:yes gene_type:complete